MRPCPVVSVTKSYESPLSIEFVLFKMISTCAGSLIYTNKRFASQNLPNPPYCALYSLSTLKIPVKKSNFNCHNTPRTQKNTENVFALTIRIQKLVCTANDGKSIRSFHLRCQINQSASLPVIIDDVHRQQNEQQNHSGNWQFSLRIENEIC